MHHVKPSTKRNPSHGLPAIYLTWTRGLSICRCLIVLHLNEHTHMYMHACGTYTNTNTNIDMYTYIYIYICNPPPLRTYHFVCFRLKRVHTFLFPVVNAFGYKFSSSRLQRILHHVCASKPLPPTQLRLLRHGFASICHLRARECFNYCRQSNSRCR